MVRIILIVLALIVFVAAILVWMGVITFGIGGRPVVNPVEVRTEMRNVTVQVPTPSVQAVPANSVQPPQ